MALKNINRKRELLKKLKNAMGRLLAPKENTPSLILIPVRAQR